MLSNYPDELTCDMAETYGVFDIKRLPVRLAATLAVGLRDDSRVKRAKTGTTCDDNTFLLACITDLLLWIRWSRTEDGVNNENNPGSPMTDYYLKRARDTNETKGGQIVFDSPEAFMEQRYGIKRD